MKQNIVITNFAKRRARMTFLVPMVAGYSVRGRPAVAPTALAGVASAGAPASQPLPGVNSHASLEQSAPAFETFDDVMPKPGDYIYPLFRALSAVLITGYWIDFSRPGVLEESVPLLYGQTVFKNHSFYDVERWLGVVNQSVWDAEGAQAGGVPGINAELKIDWKANPLIARGLLMEPPAIHSVSVTVETEFEYSHPDIVQEDRWKFFDLLGEEVNGQIVRFIVTKIISYWEISLVFKGADDLAKGDGVAEAERDSLNAGGAHRSLHPASTQTAGGRPAPPAAKEKNTVKLDTTRKAALGLQNHEGEEVPDEVLLPVLDSLAARAASGDQLVNSARAECLRLATLAEVGAEGQLPLALAEVINKAGALELEGLTQMYREKAAAKFGSTCQSCGARNVPGRSSVEAVPEEAGTAAAVSAQTASTADSLHG
ncbi:MAG TPA: hypothetical protein VGV38_03560 [Pyrinomonadaceae bacterium]|nr:hypothetical protein [Pyrinomonadaceae bacterium]